MVRIALPALSKLLSRLYATSAPLAFGAVLSCIWTPAALAQEDLGFRYREGKCVNADEEEGLNPGYVGECGGLRGVELSRQVLEGLDLSGADLHGANLRGTNFKNAILVGAQIRNAHLESADLRGADLRGARLDLSLMVNADLSGANLEGANLNRTRFIRSILRDANMVRADARRADFSGADLSFADLTGANLRGAIFDGQTILPATLPRSEAIGRGMRFRR